MQSYESIFRAFEEGIEQRKRCTGHSRTSRIERLMKKQEPRSSGFDREHLRKMKYASVESKFHALEQMIALAKEAEKSCKKRGVSYQPAFE